MSAALPAPSPLPITLDNRDVFGVAVNAWVANQPEREPWDALLDQLGRARFNGPRIRFGQRVAKIIGRIGPERFLHAALAWLGVLETAASGPAAALGYEEGWVAVHARWTNHPYLVGLLAALEGHPAPAAIAAVADFARRCYGRGDRTSRMLGREAIVTLSRQGGAAMTELLLLRLRLRQRGELAFMDKTIARAAAAGLGPEEFQDLAVPECGLTLGRRVEQFGAYQLELSLAGGRVVWRWRS
ncbi:MAG TPA: hypothetical protein VGE07_08120, partial [Herpetosiphonaceae bacterium]